MAGADSINAPTPGGTAVVLLYPGCTVAETIELTTRLVDHGLDIVHAAPDTDEFRDRSGLWLRADRPVAGIDPRAVRVLIIPGGDPGSIMEDRSVAGFVAGVAEAGGMVAAICAGVLVAAAAGVTRGRHVTHNYRAPFAPPEVEGFVSRFWESADVDPDPTRGVIVDGGQAEDEGDTGDGGDGDLVTALPTATIEFTVTVLHRLGLLDEIEAGRLDRRLRGGHVDAEPDPDA